MMSLRFKASRGSLAVFAWAATALAAGTALATGTSPTRAPSLTLPSQTPEAPPEVAPERAFPKAPARSPRAPGKVFKAPERSPDTWRLGSLTAR